MKAHLQAASLLALLFASLPAPAHAHEEDYPKDEPRYLAPTRDPAEYLTEQYIALELRLGPFRPEVDSEFAGGATPFADAYGTGPSVYLGLEVDWQLLKIPHFGSLGPGFSWGMVSYKGYGTLTSTGEESKHPTNLWVMPIYAVAVLRIDVLARDYYVPIVPYGKVGLSYSLWEASDAGSVSTDPSGVEGRGSELGFQFQLGAALHLNALAPQAALDMDNTTGVNHAYLFMEWLKTTTLTEGMNVGTSTWIAGVTLEY